MSFFRSPLTPGKEDTYLEELRHNWNAHGELDPLWAIISRPDRAASRWDPKEFFDLGEKWVLGVLASLDSKGLIRRPHRALDFGCGVGRITQALCSRFESCDGVDIAPSMIRLANEYNRYGARCRYHLNQVANLRVFQDDHFDFVISFLVLQHILPDYAVRYIKELVRVLAPGGVLIFQVPSRLASARGMPHSALSPIFDRFRRTGAASHSPSRLNHVSGPIIPMHALPEKRIRRVIARSGGKILSIEADGLAGEAWESLTYSVGK